MPERDAYEPGTPNWVDLGSPDPAASAAFYGGLFGWSSEEGPPEAGGYRMCMLKGHPAAGIGPQQGEGVWWTTYVSVPDADGTAKLAADNGGSVVVEPFDVLTAGRMAVLADPSGAAFSVWQPAEHIGAGIVNEHGAFSWSELMTRDVDGAKRFYAAVLGWGFDVMDMPGGAYTVITVGGNGVGGIMAPPPEVPAEVPDYWVVYFTVDDADATIATAVELGGSVMAPSFDVEGVGRIAVLGDPHGATFNVITPVTPG